MIRGEDIRQAIRKIVEQYLVTNKPSDSKICKVISVSAGPASAVQLCDCKPLDGSAIVRDVNLLTSYANNKAGFILVPKLNSLVQISFTDDCDAFISMVSEVDFIYLNGNDYGGLVQVQALVDKLNNTESRLNKIIDAFTTWTPTPNDGGLALKTQITAAMLTPVVETQKAELENTTVLHGTGNLS